MAEAIIGVVGHADKPLAVASVVVAILLLGALAGRSWPRPQAYALVAALVALASAAVLSRPHGDAGGVLVCVAAGGVVIGALHLLLRDRAHVTVDESRRTFIRTSAVIAVATIVVGSAGEVLASRHRRRQAIERVREALKLPSRRVPVPAGADLAVEGQGSWLTSNRDFYRIDTALSPPLVDPETWTLRIHGMVDKELTLTYQDLLDRGLEHEWVTICCVSNPVGGDLIGNTLWGGVPIKGILDEVGIQPGADALLSTSDDGWTCGTPLEALTDGRNALLALTMNGEPLPIPHGFPVRQVVPGLYGYVSATKWVVDWEVTRFADFKAYWTQRGWGERGPVKTESRIDVPHNGADPRCGYDHDRGRRVGAARRRSRASRSGSTAARGRRRRSARCPTSTRGSSGGWSGRPNRATTRSRRGRRTPRASRRPANGRTCCPTGRRATPKISVKVA